MFAQVEVETLPQALPEGTRLGRSHRGTVCMEALIRHQWSSESCSKMQKAAQSRSSCIRLPFWCGSVMWGSTQACSQEQGTLMFACASRPARSEPFHHDACSTGVQPQTAEDRYRAHDMRMYIHYFNYLKAYCVTKQQITREAPKEPPIKK